MLFRRLAAGMAVVCAQVLGGCYEVDREVIPVSAGVQLPMSSPIRWNNGAQADFTYSPATRDYRFSDRNNDGKVRTGSARAMPIRGNIYALQLHYDNVQGYELVFVQVTPSRFDTMDPVGNVQALADRFGVTLSEGIEFEWRLEGEPGRMLAFLRAHSELQFEVTDYSDLERLWRIDQGSAGGRFAILRAPGSDHGMVRVVRGPERARPRQRAARWAGFEVIITKDIAGLHRRLADHPDFKPYQAPIDYDFTHAASNLHQAFSAKLPGGTHVTMTMGVTQPKKRKFPTARTQVGQIFQAPLNTPVYARCRGFYETTLGMEVTLESGGTHGPIHDSWKVPAGPVYVLDILKGDAPDSGRGCIEIHGLPAGFIDPDPPHPTQFDGGTCMATFFNKDVGAVYRAVSRDPLVEILAQPTAVAPPPYRGAQAFCFAGPDGERGEIIGRDWT
jgi:hypothetical protein